ncbi:MAG: hypothetical protein VKJ09_03275 [Leptolyngbya sp.]|nr:hypothetical protein [Leptolyngbya sp.]
MVLSSQPYNRRQIFRSGRDGSHSAGGILPQGDRLTPELSDSAPLHLAPLTQLGSAIAPGIHAARAKER